jgi:hypothetical protein
LHAAEAVSLALRPGQVRLQFDPKKPEAQTSHVALAAFAVAAWAQPLVQPQLPLPARPSKHDPWPQKLFHVSLYGHVDWQRSP